MSENLQLNLFGKDAEKLLQPSYLEDFHASPIVLQENVWRLMMTAICGRNYCECFATLEQDGLWVKTYQGYYQVKMDSSWEEYCGTWPKWGAIHGGTAFLPTLAALNISGNGLQLWPRPIASDGEAWTKSRKASPMKSIWSCWKRGKQDRTIYYHIQNGISPVKAAQLNGMMMGFPKGWVL